MSKFRLTIEIDDPTNEMDDAPDSKSVKRWTHYLGIENEDPRIRLIKAERSFDDRSLCTTCHTAHGLMEKHAHPCDTCGGSGEILHRSALGVDWTKPCPKCSA